MKGFSLLLSDAKKEGISRVHVSAAVLLQKTLLLIKRPETAATHPGYYVFPTSEATEAESLNQVLQKALVVDAGLSLKTVEKYVGHFDYEGTRQLTFLVTVTNPSEVFTQHHVAHAWVPLKEVSGYPISDELRHIVELLLRDGM